MKTLYAILNQNTKRWWYHQQLRNRGKVEESRKRERESIRSSVRSLRQCLSQPGGYASVGRGGWSVHTGRGSYLSGHGSDINDAAHVQAALLLGIPVVDTTTIPDDKILGIIKFPMIAVDGDADEARDGNRPYGSLSYAPLDYVFKLYVDLGATVYNWPR